MASVLLVEDDRGLRTSLRHALEARGHEVVEAAGLAQARPHFMMGTLNVAIVDVGLQDGSGLDLLDCVRVGSEPPAVIVMSGQEDLDLTIAAIRKGAVDFMFKPLDLHELEKAVGVAIEHRAAAIEARRHPTTAPAMVRTVSLVGRSTAMRDVAKRIAQAAATDEPVLLTGESGTGKEVAARTIHHASQRAALAFVAVNCAALTSTLLESELFGSSRGSFTGAVTDRIGRFEAAADGTLFLDEIGELPLDLQPKLLRVLQERTFERVGETRPRAFDARILAATNRDLLAEVKAGRFRADLFYRLNVLTVALPPLRARMEDVEVLVARLLAVITGPGQAPRHIESAAITRMGQHDWPGNVRELGNVLRRAVAMSPHSVITSATVDAAMKQGESPAGSAPAGEGRGHGRIPTMLEMERQLIERALSSCGWNKRQASRVLGISRPTLDRKIREFGLRRPSSLDGHGVDDPSESSGVTDPLDMGAPDSADES